VDQARGLVDDLLSAGVEEHHIHLVAKDHVSLDKAHLAEAGLLQKSEFIPAVEKGAAFGGVTGVLAGIAAVSFPPAGLILGGGAILGMGLLGAGLGAWISSMMGDDLPPEQLLDFEAAIEEGKLLMLIDVPNEQSRRISALLEQHQDQWLQG
jgi:hypothetical protein